MAGTYRGIDGYKKKPKYKKRTSRGKKKPSKRKSRKWKNKFGYRNMFLVVLLSIIIAIFAIKSTFIKDTMKLSDESITYYISQTDKVSIDKLQVNWQEVAAIDLALNNGKAKLDNEDGVNKIAESFLKYDDNKNLVGINSLKVSINELGLNTKEGIDAENYLVKIKGNYLNRDLIKDKNKTKFIANIENEAKKNYIEYKILPSVTMAQAILESGWGESTLSSKHNNLFGIKADERWNGDKVNMETKENYDDVITGYFRAYKNYEASINDHGKFLSENSRYKDNGIFDSKTYEGQTQALENAGYATVKNEEGEPIYADLLEAVIRNNNLMLFDTEVQR
ncbi:MAG: glycoside hydrolase family 73 protein [Clostridium sp.]